MKLARFFAIALLFAIPGSVLAQQPTPTPNPTPSPSVSQAPSPTPSVSPTPFANAANGEYMPNDPKFDLTASRVTGLPSAYAVIKAADLNGAVKMSNAVVAVFDQQIDCSHPEFVHMCRADLAFDATDVPVNSSDLHGMGSAGTGFADTDNGLGVSSTGGISKRLSFFPVRICDGNTCRPEWIIKGLNYVLQKKREGVPIVAIGFNLAGGVGGLDVDKILKDLDAEQIDIIAPGPNNTVPVNIDELDIFPVSYVDRYPNIISVTAADNSGQRLLPGSAYGPKKMQLVGPGDSVKTISLLDPANGSGSISGASAVTFQVTALYGLIRIYRDSTSVGARFILRYTAHMYPDLEGKVNAAPGNDEIGRMAGKIDANDALSLPFGCSGVSTTTIMWVTSYGTNRAVAVSTPLMTTGPFSLTGITSSMNPDGLSRIMLFAYNIGENASAITVSAKDSAGRTVTLPVEAAKALPSPLSCVTQFNVVLTTQPALAAGDVTLKITANNQMSGDAVITAKP